MSKTVFGILLSLVCMSSRAQVKFVAFAGPQSTSVLYKVRDAKQDAERKWGFQAGAALKVPFDNQLFFYPTIYYSRKGYHVTLRDTAFPPSVYALNNNTIMHTMEISPMFHIDFSKQASHAFIRFGPAIDIAFSGKERFDSVSPSGTIFKVSRPMTFSFGDYGRFSASANIHLGYESSQGFMVYAFYAHGIGSMNNADYGPKIFHRIFGLSVGWTFGGHNPLVHDTRVIDK